MPAMSDIATPSGRPSLPLSSQLGSLGKLSCGSSRWGSSPALFPSTGKDVGSSAWKSAASYFNGRDAGERLPLLADLEAGPFGSLTSRFTGEHRVGPTMAAQSPRAKRRRRLPLP